MATCYRHPDRETGVSCSNCGRSICPDCMTPTPVGMRCPECSKQRTKVKTAQTMMIATVTRGSLRTVLMLWTFVRCLAHSGQRIPTGVAVMQSGQIGRPQFEHATPVSRSGWR